MSTLHNDMDALDDLLAETLGIDDPKTNTNASAAEAPTEAVTTASVSPAPQPTQQNMASVWTDVIERATANMQDSARMSQQATQKNIELAKQQNEGIKELSEASTGWRNIARQTYEEIMSAKKSVRNMSIFVLLSVVVGTSLTASFTWYQGKNTQQGNQQVQETVEEYYNDMRKTLTSKLDEMAGLIEQIPSTPVEPRKKHSVNEEDAVQSEDIHDSDSIATSEVLLAQEENFTRLEDQVAKVLQMITQQQTQQEQMLAQIDALRTTTPTTETVIPAIAPTAQNQSNNLTSDAVLKALTQTQKVVAQLQDKIVGLEQQLSQADKHVIETQDQLRKQGQSIQQIPSQLDTKLASLEQAVSGLKQDMKQWQTNNKSDDTNSKLLADQLAKLQKELLDIKQLQQTIKANKSQTNTAQDKEISEQVIRLQRDIQEIKQQQNGIKDQVKDVKQNLPTTSSQPYQYRLDVERYPR